ncbi:hypothetical protein DOY81_011676, partial [Sarcophaga bullata]
MSRKLNSSFDKSVGSPKNSIFNYFSRSPAALEKKKIPRTPSTEEKNQDNGKKLEKANFSNQKNKSPTKQRKLIEKKKPSLDSEEETFAPTTKKRRRLLLQDSDSEEETKTKAKEKNNTDYTPNGDEEMASACKEEEEGETKKDSSPEVKKSKHKTVEHKSKKAKLDGTLTGSTFMEKLQQLQANSEDVKTNIKQETKCEELTLTSSTLDEPVIWPHQKLEFLKPDKIKDKKGRRPEHPEYDPSTLYVPSKFL